MPDTSIIERWGLHYMPGKHEGLISVATFQKVQDRRNGIAKAPARKDLREDFPLRGFVCCASWQRADDRLLVERPLARLSLLSLRHQGLP
jgi:hypothetical protein